MSLDQRLQNTSHKNAQKFRITVKITNDFLQHNFETLTILHGTVNCILAPMVLG